MILYLRSLLFNLLFPLWTALIGILGLLPILCIPSGVHIISRLWANGTLGMLRVICNIRYIIKGYEHLPEGNYIIASKHQSAWETIIFLTLLHNPVYVLKRELLYIPVYGFYLLRLGMIAINRSAGASALKEMLKETKKRLNQGKSVIIFPEGTRTAPGASVSYHSGIASLYQYTQTTVIPVAHNAGLYWGKNSFLKKPGTITLTFLPPITPGLDKTTFMTELKEHIETASHALISES